MIDIHCHLLDETGCGPQDFAESVMMCRRAITDGVRVIVATVRWNAGADQPPLPFPECERKLEKLQLEMGDALQLKLGFMLKFRADLPELATRFGSLLALGGGQHLLVSVPSMQTPDGAETVWRALSEKGFSVVVAHPECSPALRRHPSRLDAWTASGVTLQLDAASITGAHGREVQRFAIHCLQKYTDHIVIASNARRAQTHGASLSSACDYLLRIDTAGFVRRSTYERPAAIINYDKGRPFDSHSRSRYLTLLRRSLRPHKPLKTSS